MVLRKKIIGVLASGLLLLGLGTAEADGREEAWSPKEKGEVSLPLGEYLRLVDAAETVRRQAEDVPDRKAAPSMRWTSQRVELIVPDGSLEGTELVELRAVLEARVMGSVEAKGLALTLPVDGWPAQLDIVDGPSAGAAWATQDGQRRLWAKEPGTYRVKVRGRLPVLTTGRSKRVRFPDVVAPSVRVQVDLPAAREWNLDGEVVKLAEREADGRRHLEFALSSGRPWLEMKGPTASGAQRLLASSVVATVVQLQRTGRLRHDVALFDVSRGELDALRVTLPAGARPDRAVTDEGAVEWIDPERSELEVSRREPLTGRGFVAVVSPLEDGAGSVSLEPLATEVATRAHYLAVVGPVPALAEPPAEAWLRVDAADLPAELGQALGMADLVTVWRRIEGRDPGVLRITTLPDAPRVESQARRRDTTTLLTVDGTLLHRDVLYIQPVGSVLELDLPEGAVLWSAEVGGQGVRPIERDGKLLLPLGPANPGGDEVELVTVLEKAVPQGRSSLMMTLPELALPVLDHRWQVLLPWQNQYRLRAATLSPVPAGYRSATFKEGTGPSLVGTVTDSDGGALPGVTVTVESEGRHRSTVSDGSGGYKFFKLDEGRKRRSWSLTAELEGFNTVRAQVEVRRGKVAQYDFTMPVGAVAEAIIVTAEVGSFDLADRQGRRAEKESQVALDHYRSNVAGLQQGLVGGVRPVPVAIPTEGKVLSLVGVLPEGPVTLQLDVKKAR